MPKILDLHIAFEFVKQMLLAMAVLVLLAVLVHVAQQSAELSRTDATFIDVLGVVFLRLPFLVTEITFLYMFIGGLMALGKLTTSTEATVIKSVGYSGWRVIFVSALTAAMIGALIGPLLSPLAASAMRQSVEWEQRAFGKVSIIGIYSKAPSVNWAQMHTQIDGAPAIVSFKPGNVHHQENRMTNVRVNIFDPSLSRRATIDSQAYQRWMHAESAQVDGDVTHFYDVTLAQPNKRPTFADQVTLPIAPDLAAYQRGGPAPSTLGLYDLILNQGALEAAGVRTPIHVLRTQQLLSMPLLSFGAVLFSSIFAMRSVRHGRRGLWVTLGYISGANLFFLNDLTKALGTQSVLQAQLTIWILPIALTLISLWLLSYLEDS